MKRCIVIPFYNEEKKLKLEAFKTHLIHYNTDMLIFVNDASTDNTRSYLEELKEAFPKQVHLLDLPENSGKAEAIRQGVLQVALLKNADWIAFMDADLAYPFSELDHFFYYINQDPQRQMAFGCRVVRLGAKIDRGFTRHLVSRFLATIISNILKIKVYDTQAGIKMFKPLLASILFKDPFISRWLFDVELFARFINHFGRKELQNKAVEVPVNWCLDPGDSKVKKTYFWRLFKELYQIKKKYSLR